MKNTIKKDLPGNQDKLDVAEPKGKLTGADFKKLRSMKKENEDHEVSMAKSSLESIIQSAQELIMKMGDQERNIPGWIQDHITNAENYIDQAAQGFHELAPEPQEEPQGDMSLTGMVAEIISEAKKKKIKK